MSGRIRPSRRAITASRRRGVTGVTAIAEPGGSLRSAEVEAACAEHGTTLVRTGLRLFHH